MPRARKEPQPWESDRELTGRVNTDLSFDEALGVLLNAEQPPDETEQ